MFDRVILYLQSALHYPSDIPVLLFYSAIIIYGLSQFVTKIWVALSLSAITIVVLYFPFYYVAPSFSKGLAGMGLISKQWLKDQDVARSIGIGFMVGIVFAVMLLYLIISAVIEMLKRTNKVYVLATKKKPRVRDYMNVSPNKISEYVNADIDLLEVKLSSTDITFIKNSFNDQTQIKTAMAWVCKGLPVSRAVRKTKFDLGDHSVIYEYYSVA